MEDDFDSHYALIISGGERTRGILYFFTILILVCVITSANNYFDTAGRRLTALNAAVACAQNSTGADKKVPLEAFKPNTTEQGFCKFYYDYVEHFYGLKTTYLAAPSDAASKTSREEELTGLLEKRSVILKQYDDNDFISVPILNFKVDGNFEVQLQSLVAALVLSVLALSISAEIAALRAAGPSATKKSQAQLVLHSHVFLRPSKVNAVLWLFLFLPFITEVAEAWRDWDQHEDVLTKLYPGRAGLLFYGFEGASLLLCLVLAI
jgi:hypothetical protein